MADQEGADPLPDPTLMSRKKLIAEVVANREQIAHDKEQNRKARDLMAEKLSRYYNINRQQEEALHYIEGKLREANKLLGRDPEHGIDFRDENGEKSTQPIPMFSDDKISPPVFDPRKAGFK